MESDFLGKLDGLLVGVFESGEGGVLFEHLSDVVGNGKRKRRIQNVEIFNLLDSDGNVS